MEVWQNHQFDIIIKISDEKAPICEIICEEGSESLNSFRGRIEQFFRLCFSQKTFPKCFSQKQHELYFFGSEFLSQWSIKVLTILGNSNFFQTTQYLFFVLWGSPQNVFETFLAISCNCEHFIMSSTLWGTEKNFFPLGLHIQTSTITFIIVLSLFNTLKLILDRPTDTPTCPCIKLLFAAKKNQQSWKAAHTLLWHKTKFKNLLLKQKDAPPSQILLPDSIYMHKITFEIVASNFNIFCTLFEHNKTRVEQTNRHTDQQTDRYGDI